MHEIRDALTSTGIFVQSSNNGTPGDQEMFVIMKAYEYYCLTQDSTFLTTYISRFNDIGDYLKNWYDTDANGKSADNNFFGGKAYATYLDSAGNQIGGRMSTVLVDPIMQSILIYSLRCLAELNTAAGNTTKAATWNAWRTTLAAQMPEMWVESKGWPAFNISISEGTTVENPHLMKVDALVFDALEDEEKQAAMVAKLSGTDFWNGATAVAGFQMFRPYNLLFSGLGTGWYGSPWHIGDYKAFTACFG